MLQSYHMNKTQPTLTEEEKLWQQGIVLVGVDEAGRGPLAGPVVACALAFNMNDKKTLAFIPELGINDSKKVTEKNRERIFEIITNNPSIWWATGQENEKTIDTINILQASLSAMHKAVFAFEEKYKISQKKYLYIDGREIIPEMTINQKAVIGGDAKILSIAAASIIAKVTRDRLMYEYAKKYPEYQFEKHKGYGTKLHFELVKKHGMSPIHRKSFLKKLQ